MASNDVAVRPRRSAFAAAFLSFIFPGLGHAYLGRWLRALAWAALPILGLAALGGLALSPDRNEYLTMLADPAVLQWVLALLVFDLVYRLLALLDAWRLARDTSVGTAGTRLLSVAGLVGIVVVLLGSHVAAAQPVLIARDTINAVTENAGDDSEIADLEALAAQDDSFVLNFEELEPQVSLDPNASPGALAPIRGGHAGPAARWQRSGGAHRRAHAEREGLGRQEASQHPARRRRWRSCRDLQLPHGHDDRGQHRPHHGAGGLHLAAT